METEKSQILSNIDEETVTNYLQNEINSALTRGGFIGAIIGFSNFIFLIIVNLLHIVSNLWLPCIFAFIAGMYCFIIYKIARKGKFAGKIIYIIFLPFISLPTVFFLATHFLLPEGTATYITGPFSYLYFIMILLTGFIFDYKLSYLAGILSGTGYFLIYLLARNHLMTLNIKDPVLLQDLSSPVIYLIKSLMMIFGGFLMGSLSVICRKLIFRVLKAMDEWHGAVQ